MNQDETKEPERKDKKTGVVGIIGLYVLYALPIPLSVASWIGTLMGVANIGATDWTTFPAWIHGSVAIVAMLAAGAYPITYLISLVSTIRDRSSAKRYWPICHILAAIVLIMIWTGLDVVF